MSKNQRKHIEEQLLSFLTTLYGQAVAESTWTQLKALLEKFSLPQSIQISGGSLFSEKDAILITYGDTFRMPGQPPLATLKQFADCWLDGAINGIHILPFYPYSSDDGFSVIDYRQVDPQLGNWKDVARLGQGYRLMFDGVINHVSQFSQWFQAYLNDDSNYRDYFITAESAWDLTKVVRPRTLPLLTSFKTRTGTRQVWTTFSADQIDLNYANPQVLVEMIGILLDYVAYGAKIIRLDAIAYLWKEPGSSCIHLPQTHLVIKIMRRVLDLVAPNVVLLTETNVPHYENISYFGERDFETGLTDEAQMVYQFPLAPLVLHSFASQNARTLSEWVTSLEAPGLFFNFIASHDGIGVQPARGLLSETQIQCLVERTLAHGGLVSYKHEADGNQIPYELNITLYDALNDPAQVEPEMDWKRFLASQVIMLSLAGVPGIYIHSLLGSRNCLPLVQETGRARSINREKFNYDELKQELELGKSQRAKTLTAYRQILATRRQHPAFHPEGRQKVLFLHPKVFALVRFARARNCPVVCLVNVSASDCTCCLDVTKAAEVKDVVDWQDLLTGTIYHPTGTWLEIPLVPYQYCWLKPAPKAK